MKDYEVTICCLAYNHEKYIERTINGFLDQKTEFNYKILVHDDASSDRTLDILMLYKEKYPDKIEVIKESKNQYSQGIDVFEEILLPKVQTKYIAICDGDDYWCEETKLQMQYNYLENNNDCSLCMHNSVLIDGEGNIIRDLLNINKNESDYSTAELIENNGGTFAQLSSFFLKTEDRRKMPNWCKMKGIGDWPLIIYLSTIGRVHYFPQPMSCYRVMALGSWTEKMNSNRQLKIDFNNNAIKAFELININTQYKYSSSIKYAIAYREFSSLSNIMRVVKGILFPKYWRVIIRELKHKYESRFK